MLALLFLLMRWCCGWDLLYCPSVSIDACSQTRVSAHSHAVLFHTTSPYPSFWNITIHRDNQSILFSQPVLLKKAKTLRSVTHSHRERQRQRSKRERDLRLWERDTEIWERERERENVLKPVKGSHYSVTVSHHQCFNGVYNHLHQLTI